MRGAEERSGERKWGRKVSGCEEWVTGQREWSREGSTGGDGEVSSAPAFVNASFSGRVPTFYFVHFRFMT